MSERNWSRIMPISTIPTCEELSRILLTFGNFPLLSSHGDWAVTGFRKCGGILVRTFARRVYDNLEGLDITKVQ